MAKPLPTVPGPVVLAHRSRAEQYQREALALYQQLAVEVRKPQGRTLDWQTMAHQFIKALTVEMED